MTLEILLKDQIWFVLSFATTLQTSAQVWCSHLYLLLLTFFFFSSLLLFFSFGTDGGVQASADNYDKEKASKRKLEADYDAAKSADDQQNKKHKQ